MKIVDVIFALVCGRLIGFVVGDFLKSFGIPIGLYENIALWIVLPLFALFCLWLAAIMGRKWPFIYQVAKFLLIGGAATVIDLKIFELLVWGIAFFVVVGPWLGKAISFLIAMAIKYWGNKYWTFQKPEKEGMHIEIAKLVIMDVLSLAINLIAFYIFTALVGPRLGLSPVLWVKLSVILAALASAVSNFLGYKFFVFT